MQLRLHFRRSQWTRPAALNLKAQTRAVGHGVEADLAMKEKALARLDAPVNKLRRFRARDSLMHFLEAL